MPHLCIRDLVEITGGRLRLGDMPPLGGELEPLGRVVVDCGQVQPGDVFWSLEREAGREDLPEEAFARSALGVVTSGRRVEPWAGKFAIQVDDSRAALRQLVRAVRCRYTGFVVAVAGHTGKTTAATWMEAVLAARGTGIRPAPAASAEFDPRSLLELTVDRRFGVFELPGPAATDTAAFLEQAQWISPHAAVLLNAQAGWPESTDLTRVTRQIQALRDALPSEGMLIVNGDDELITRALPAATEQILRIGRGTRCDWAASSVRLGEAGLEFSVDGLRLRVPAAGRHQLLPALAAYAVGRLAGIHSSEIARRLAQVSPPEGTCRVLQRRDLTVLADCPRGRPVAAQAALAALRDVPVTGRRIVLAGDLFRDHTQAVELTRRYGDAAVTRFGADVVVSFGSRAEELTAAVRAAGLGVRQAVTAAEADEAVDWVRRGCRTGDAILVTGATADETRRLTERLTRVSGSAAA
ncbi:MAG: Mur ligase family protein [Pirellulales bacterium]